MNTHSPRLRTVAALITVLAGCGELPDEAAVRSVTQAGTETWTIACWRASLYDTDGDGYARHDATEEQRTTFTYTTEA